MLQAYVAAHVWFLNLSIMSVGIMSCSVVGVGGGTFWVMYWGEGG